MNIGHSQRQSPIAILFILLKAFVNIVKSLWPFLLVFIFSGKSSNLDLYFMLIGILTIAATMITGTARYYRYFFTLTPKDFHISKGIFKRSHTTIPYERVQVVNTVENILHKYTNTLGLSIETAGSSSKELEISALAKSEALAIKEYIHNRKSKLKTHRILSNDFQTEKSEEELIMKLNFRDVLRYGLSHNHFRSLGLVMGVAAAVFGQLESSTNTDFLEEIIFSAGNVLLANIIYIVAGIGILLLVTIFLSIIMNVLRYYNLSVYKFGESLKVRSGLIQVREVLVKKPRIQLYRWSTNPLRKLIGLSRIALTQAGKTSGNKKQTIVIAGAKDLDSSEILDFTFGDKMKSDFYSFTASPKAKWRYILYFAITPFLLAFPLLYYFKGAWAFFLLIWTAIMSFILFWWFKHLKYKVNKENITVETSLYTKSIKIAEINKVQAINLQQTPYQGRKNLSTLRCSITGGKLSFLYIPYELAAKLRDYLLYKIESSDEEWM